MLRVQGARHSLLLTGDIGVAQERALAPALPPTDVVMAPHHGSATSSSLELIAATRAGHVIAQAGMLNRFRHPAPAVEHRWTAAGVRFWRSDRDGAVVAESCLPNCGCVERDSATGATGRTLKPARLAGR